jgi:hypothetical protein
MIVLKNATDKGYDTGNYDKDSILFALLQFSRKQPDESEASSPNERIQKNYCGVLL